MSTLFISDLHLEAERPDITRSFIKLLQEKVLSADALYILGDFFASWIGDDDRSSLMSEVVNALKSITAQGVPVYFMPGNRDFLLGKEFMRQTGCRLLSDPCVIDLYGIPTLLMHGDSLCTDDKMYLRFRALARNPFVQRFFLSLPLSVRKEIAKMLRKTSSLGAPKKQNSIKYEANWNEIKRVMLLHQVQLLIHGHTHKPSIQYSLIQDQYVTRIVLSDWDITGNVLVCSENGERRLLSINNSHPHAH